MEPHTISRFTWTVDEEKRVPVRFDATNAEGTVVASTTYSELTETAPGRWVALRAETVVLPGMIPTPPAPTETEGAHIRVDGMTVTAEYTWLPDAGLCVVARKAYSDDQGRALLELMFDDYELDLGLDDSLFQTEPPQEPADDETPREGDE